MSDFASWIRSLSKVDPEFGKYYLERSWPTWHYLHIIHGLTLRNGLAASAELAQDIRTVKPRNLIQSLNAGQCPNGLSGVLQALPRRHLHKNAYQRLLSLLNEPTAAKLLCHQPKITSGLLSMLETLDPDLRDPKLINQFRNPADLQKLRDILSGLAKTCPALPPATIRARLLQKLANGDAKKSPRRMRRHSCSIEEAAWAIAAEHAEFPPAPWLGDACLSPITNAEDLRCVAKQFRNCIGNFLAEILRQEAVFYVYYGQRENAVIKLTRDVLHGWVIEEMKGYRNSELSRSVKRDLETRFSRVGIDRQPSWSLSSPDFVIGDAMGDPFDDDIVLDDDEAALFE